MPTIEEVIRNRVSLRKFADRPVAKDDFDFIVEAAMRAPTAGNMMMYSMIVINDPAKKQRLSETCDHQPFIATAPLVVVFVADMQRWFDYHRVTDTGAFCKRTGLDYSGPDEADLLLACSDTLIAAQNAAVAAESRGVGSCYIGDIMERFEIHRELLGLPSYTFPIAMLCFGYYPDGPRPAPRPRFERKYIVFEDKYHRLDECELRAMFADNEARFDVGSNPYGAENFSQAFYARKTGSKFMAEMARSVRVAMQNWRGGPVRDERD